ncbi:MAG: hypothetical protein MI924_17965 [Chloroflexales bacterium]|nr:hypothetical protein [Chloroflexales bacterium]
MQCPNCEIPKQSKIHVCQACGAAYTAEDVLELSQLEFLLVETADWPEADTRSKPYAERRAALKGRFAPTAAPASAIPPSQEILPPPVTLTVEPAPARPTPPPVPFDQWLLSERNIKLALYSGGILLVLAGLIFIGVRWAYIPGPAKFAITLMITGLMYLSGHLLFQHPTLKLGGIALLGVASGFAPLNFAVLQIYIFSAWGLNPNTMWLIGSLSTALLYALTAYWTRSSLFTYLGIGAAASSFTAALVLMEPPLSVVALAYALLLLGFLLGAYAFRSTQFAPFTCNPLLIVSHLAMPVLFFFSATLWALNNAFSYYLNQSSWPALAAMLIGVSFYVTTDRAFRWIIARWAAAFTFAITCTLAFTELGFLGTATGIALMALALAYLLVGYALEQRTGNRSGAWPLYITGYAVAAFVVFKALGIVEENPAELAKALLGIVALLGISARVHRQYAWIYAAAWVFIAPVFIYANLYLPDLPDQGLVLGVLMLNYTAAGYMLGRCTLRLGGPFLTAAAFLSVVVAFLAWTNAVVASSALAVIAVLYLFFALWQRWHWLLLPALIAVNLAVVTILRIFLTAEAPWANILTIAYASLGVVLTLGGAWLRRSGQQDWGWPLYLVAAFNSVCSYLVGSYLDEPIALGLSATFALLAFGMAWIERAAFTQAKLPPFFSYLGALLIFIGHFYALILARNTWQDWPISAASLCMLFTVAAYFLRYEAVRTVYGIPLRRAGEWLMLAPLGGVFFFYEPQLGAATFAIAGVTYAIDAVVQRMPRLGYLAGGAFIGVIWSLLLKFEVGELQAYAMPLGFGLLVLGWNERRMGGREAYVLSTLLGLSILMGSAFYQSFDAIGYAVLLLVESLAALAWGMRSKSRGYVQLGVLSMVVNAIAQFGPSFVELPRWVQLGVIGSLLLGGGLIALFQRERLLITRKRLNDEWSQWQA